MFTITHVIGRENGTRASAYGPKVDTFPEAVDWCDAYGDDGDRFIICDTTTGNEFHVTVGHGMGNGTHVSKA